MTETRKHIEAFELYYSQGAQRAYSKVAKELHTSKQVVAKWGKEFEWLKRVEERDREVCKAVVEKSVAEEVDARVELSAAIVETVALYRENLRKGSIDISSVKDLQLLVDAYAKITQPAQDNAANSLDSLCFSFDLSGKPKEEGMGDED